VLSPGHNLITGERSFQRAIGETPTSLERDLLTVASAIYAADLGVPRGEREQATRAFCLSIPVTNLHAFQSLRDQIEHVLYLLTSDSWEVRFKPKDGVPESRRAWPSDRGATLLFSGGLDSLAMAVERAEAAHPTVLVSHDSGNRVAMDSQSQLAAYLSRLSGGRMERFSIRARPQASAALGFPATHEPSQRSRSFLYAAIAALTARRRGYTEVLFVAENGQMAIHLPLTTARLGPFSTRTAHPSVLAAYQTILTSLLGIELSISNPYVYRTKAEVVSRLCSVHPGEVSVACSCWRGSRVTVFNHCGDCVPCIIRRVSLEVNGYFDREWARDLFREKVAALPDDDVGKRNLVDVVEFARLFAGNRSDEELALRHFPGLISRHFDQAQATAMYRRFACEARDVLKRYSYVMELGL